MRSSYKVIKNQNISGNTATSYIETKIDLPLPIKEVDSEKEETIDDGVSYYNVIRNEMMLKVQKEKEKIIKEANKEAEIIKADARKKAYKEGYETGYNKGIAKSREDGDLIKANAVKLISDADKHVKQYYEDNKDKIIDLAGKMAEEIIHHSIDTSNEDILLLINPILETYDIGDSIVITCNPKKIPAVKSKISKWEKDWTNTRFLILEDANLERNGCTIENEHQFIDLQIRKQIENMVEEINNME